LPLLLLSLTGAVVLVVVDFFGEGEELVVRVVPY